MRHTGGQQFQVEKLHVILDEAGSWVDPLAAHFTSAWLDRHIPWVEEFNVGVCVLHAPN